MKFDMSVPFRLLQCNSRFFKFGESISSLSSSIADIEDKELLFKFKWVRFLQCIRDDINILPAVSFKSLFAIFKVSNAGNLSSFIKLDKDTVPIYANLLLFKFNYLTFVFNEYINDSISLFLIKLLLKSKLSGYSW